MSDADQKNQSASSSQPNLYKYELIIKAFTGLLIPLSVVFIAFFLNQRAEERNAQRESARFAMELLGTQVTNQEYLEALLEVRRQSVQILLGSRIGFDLSDEEVEAVALISLSPQAFEVALPDLEPVNPADQFTFEICNQLVQTLLERIGTDSPEVSGTTVNADILEGKGGFCFELFPELLDLLP